jgi:glycerol-3-phosphate acyltransferase PlsY
VYGLLTLVLVLWALRPNIKRLLNGTEPRSPKVDLG